jgi:serine protease AprX
MKLRLLTILLLFAAPFFPVTVHSQTDHAESAAWGSRTQAPHPEKLGPELKSHSGKSSEQMLDVIVQYRSIATEAHHQKVRALGGQLKNTLDLVKGALYAVPASALDSLSSDDEVVYITPNRQLQANDTITNVTVGANVAQNWGYNGDGMTVAVIDSGIQDGPDVGGNRIKYRHDWTNGKNKDDYGHGTHVAGIIGSTHPNYGGIAPKANYLDLRVLDQNGAGTDANVIAAIQKAISLSSQYNVVAINLSLGRAVMESYKLDPLCQAVEQAWKSGIVVVVAAGNGGRTTATSGYGTINAPGNDPYVITVGAMKDNGTSSRSDDLMTTYSSKGPTLLDHIVKPDLVAPGNLTVSNMPATATLYTTYPANVVSPGYFSLSGTSMATPVVTGAALLMLDQNGGLSPDLIKARLMKTATKNFPPASTYTDPYTKVTYQIQYDIFAVGAGYLDITNALQSNDSAKGAALSPAAVYNASTQQVKIVTASSAALGSSVVWGSSVAWGNSVVWGSAVFASDDFSVAWGSSVIWGSDAGDGFSLIWGSDAGDFSLIWGSALIQVASSPVSITGER